MFRDYCFAFILDFMYYNIYNFNLQRWNSESYQNNLALLHLSCDLVVAWLSELAIVELSCASDIVGEFIMEQNRTRIGRIFAD